ncbi:MAG: putative 2-dehydropantoate 2-reductase [Phormidesmis sp.]
MSRLRYAIIGTGAIGGYYGARLQRSGCDVHFLLRSDYERVQQQGLSIVSKDGDFDLPQVNAYRDPVQMPPVDVAIVALKTTHNHHLPSLLPPLRANGTTLSLQNGWAIETDISQVLEQQKISVPTLLGGLCFICSKKVSPGRIHHIDYGKVLLGAYSQNHQPCAPTARMRAIAADFNRADLPIELIDDLPMARWRKLVWNVPYNGLSVVLNATTEAMMANQDVRSLITTLMQEVIMIANAWGQQATPNSERSLSPDVITQMLNQTEQMPPYRTSMKVDYDEGRALEIDAILSKPIRVAQTLDIAVPTMTMLHQQLSFINANLSLGR